MVLERGDQVLVPLGEESYSLQKVSDYVMQRTLHPSLKS